MSICVTVNRIYLYDNPDLYANILEGFITFSNGSTVEFGPLNKDGSATVLAFPETKTARMEIVVTKSEGDRAGLTEIEAYEDTAPAQRESFLMAVDSGDNFVYDHILHGSDTVQLRVFRFPDGVPLSENDLTLTFRGNGTACSWEGTTLTVTCPKGKHCDLTVSDGLTQTTFTVSNPGSAEYAYLRTLRFVEGMTLNFRNLIFVTTDYIKAFLPTN